jgi:hypothetical protein
MLVCTKINSEMFDVDATNNDGQSLIWLASKKGFAGIVTFCLQLKANVNLPDLSEKTCLDVAKNKKCRKTIAAGLQTIYMPPASHGGRYSQQI